MPIEISVGGSSTTWLVPVLQTLVQAVVTGLFVLAAAWLGVKFALQRHVQTKWWDRKAEVFYRINGAIYGLVEGYKRIEKQQSGFRLSEGYMAEGEELISAGEKYLREAQGLSGLVISEEMALLIRNYFREIGENYEEMHGRFGADLVFISEKYHKKMAIQAKRELRLHTTTWQKKLWSVFTRGSKEFWLYTNSRIW